MEKQCKVCSFWDWKPKEPKLMKTMKTDSTKKDKKKKRELKDCYPEMVLVDKNCPGRNKRTRPQWNAVFPNNVCLCKCKSKVEEEKERAAAEIEQQVRSSGSAIIPCCKKLAAHVFNAFLRVLSSIKY